MPDRWVILFESVYFVMKAEKSLTAAGFNVSLIPVPRDLSSDCGMAIEINAETVEPVQVFLKRQRIAHTIHDRGPDQGRGACRG